MDARLRERERERDSGFNKHFLPKERLMPGGPYE